MMLLLDRARNVGMFRGKEGDNAVNKKYFLILHIYFVSNTYQSIYKLKSSGLYWARNVAA